MPEYNFSGPECHAQALVYKAEELTIDLQFGENDEIRKTYASAIEFAEAAGEQEQAATWRAELKALKQESSGDTGDTLDQ